MTTPFNYIDRFIEWTERTGDQLYQEYCDRRDAWEMVIYGEEAGRWARAGVMLDMKLFLAKQHAFNLLLSTADKAMRGMTFIMELCNTTLECVLAWLRGRW